MYRQIAADLQRKIETGEFDRGARLPTEIELQGHYEASRNTVRDAIKWLTIRGLAEARPGQGTFVTERMTPFVTTLTGPPESGDVAVYLAEVRASSRVPALSEPRVELQRAGRAVAYIAEQCGIKQAGYRDVIAVRAPDENEVVFFNLPADGRIPVFEIFRIGFDDTGERIRLTVTVYPADRNRFLINVGHNPARVAEEQI